MQSGCSELGSSPPRGQEAELVIQAINNLSEVKELKTKQNGSCSSLTSVLGSCWREWAYCLGSCRRNFLGGSVVKKKKKSACQCQRKRLIPGWRKLLQRRKWQPIPVLLPGESQGQRSLATV